MISVIIYGRNDQHGYNLHKRIAICFNTIAETLTLPDDEIIFVDYNTPDDYPTLVEAIRDTLTPHCRSRLRVLRIRPAVHERFRGRTHLEVLEVISRNAALRRSNPANRWILSTNGDVVLVPRDPERSLSDIAAEAPDGFYQLPRFEIPESLWESFGRQAPAEIIGTLRRWGHGLHINEVVHTDPYARFDGIGDFQLCLRKDLFAIDGFHESMLIGWNVDMNLCRRLSLIYGPPGTLLDDLFIYHCDHTRKPTITLTADVAMNDPRVYVEGVTTPSILEQADRWGLPDVVLEEFRADDTPADRFVRALERVLEPADRPYGEAWNDGTALTRLDCPPEHTLPYFADHLSTLPSSADIGYAGGSRRMLGLFTRTWRAMGGTGRILVPEALLRDIGTEGLDGVEGSSLETLFEHARLFAFEFALDAEECPAKPTIAFAGIGQAAKDRLGRVKATFLRLAAWERARSGGRPERKFVCANAVNTTFGELVRDELVFTWTPYNNRVRYGFVRPQRWQPTVARLSDNMDGFLARHSGRRLRLQTTEPDLALRDARTLLAADDPSSLPDRIFTEPLETLLAWPPLAGQLGVAPDRLADMAALVRERRASTRLRPLLPPRFVAKPLTGGDPGDDPALGKLASSEDWESERWCAWAQRFTVEGMPYRSPSYDYYRRSRGVWERTHYLYGLDLLGVLDTEADALVASAHPDGFPLFLAGRVRHVDVLKLGAQPVGPHSPDPWLAKKRWFDRDRIALHHDGAAFDGRRRFAVVTQGSLFMDDADALIRRLAWIDARLETGGVLAFSAEIALVGGGALAPEFLEALDALVATHTGLRPVSDIDWSVSAGTLDRMAVVGTDQVRNPHFLRRSGESLHLCAVRFWRKTSDTPAALWVRVATELRAAPYQAAPSTGAPADSVDGA